MGIGRAVSEIVAERDALRAEVDRLAKDNARLDALNRSLLGVADPPPDLTPEERAMVDGIIDKLPPDRIERWAAGDVWDGSKWVPSTAKRAELAEAECERLRQELGRR